MSKYNRTYHLPWSKGTTNDDRISKDISNLIGKEIIISEKLDGENTGFTNDGVYARSHATFTTSPWSREVRQLHSVKVKGYIDEDLFLFGENLEGIHSIEYSNLKSYFYLFGARLNEIWLSWDKVKEYAYLLDLETVPELFNGMINSEKELRDLVEKLINEPSLLGGEKEGVVIRLKDSFNDKDFSKCVLKWVRENHVKTDEHWTKNWRKAKINLKY